MRCNAEAEAEAEPELNYGWMRKYHNRFVNNLLHKTSRILPNLNTSNNRLVLKNSEKPLLRKPLLRDPVSNLFNNLSYKKGVKNIGHLGDGLIRAYKKTPKFKLEIHFPKSEYGKNRHSNRIGLRPNQSNNQTLQKKRLRRRRRKKQKHMNKLLHSEMICSHKSFKNIY